LNRDGVAAAVHRFDEAFPAQEPQGCLQMLARTTQQSLEFKKRHGILFGIVQSLGVEQL